MARATLGLVTIGQSPRPDIRETYAAVIGADVRIVEAGALDGLTASDLCRLAPEHGDIPLVTLANGAEVRVGKAATTSLLQQAITAVVADGATVVVVLCTGHFEGLTAPVPLIEPDRVLDGFMRAIQPSGRLGIVMPDAGQEGMMRRKWHGYDLTLATASPYQPPTEWDALIERFVSTGVEAIVLDCMGFDPVAKAYFAERAHLPVLCAQTATAHLIRDMLWEPSLVPA
ncbi:MAG: AroM family protein [Thermomicrobiales bacterium]